MHNSDYTTEYEVEKEFISVIKRNWYTYSPISSYEELVCNFRKQLNRLNKDILGDDELTNAEFKQILMYLENKSIFESSQLIRENAGKGKIDIIKRDGHTLYLKLVDLKNIENNKFEVAHQIKTVGTYSGRFDVTLLINGLPFIQIELKKPGVEIEEAFNQVLRYRRDGNYHGLFNFIQLFVISNETYTKYFCNNDVKILKSNCFVWTDIRNQTINNLYEFEEKFLFCPFLFKMVFNYMIDSASQRKLFVMRPYQIYALEALKERCLKEESNGYCFHSTGSGKTLTSFKFAFDMSKNKDIDKVFFLVDRKDLDDKTVDDFSSYMSSTSDEFTNIKKTDDLIKKIKGNDKLIISTINKMSNALKGRHSGELKPFKDKKMIFMFDECHRSQAGEMRNIIDKYFTNALYYGFTGTPIFDENDEITENTKLTALYFGKPVHTYTLKEAIADKNVLPLCIDYTKTLKMNDNLYLLDKEVEAIDYESALIDDRRCDIVAKDVLDHYELKTRGRRYNAIFACQSILLLNKYYKLLLNNRENLKIAAIYSYEANEDADENDNIISAKDELAKIIDEYNKRPENNSNFSISTYAAYERDVINNFRNKNIDILLVVNKCLTGMDFVKCNTLYLDKSLKMHGLIQAFSRTIRTCDASKECGNIVCYQTSKKSVDEALTHFNNDEDVYNDVTLKPLEKLEDELNAAFEDCKSKRKLGFSKSEKDQLEFVKSFRELMRIYNKIINYSDFDIEKTDVDMKTYFELQSTYKEIYKRIVPTPYKESILNDIDFEIELIDRIKVNFDYIMELLNKYQDGDKEKNIKRLYRVITEISEKSKRDLVKAFVDGFMNDNIDGLYRKDPVEEYKNFINNEKDKELTNIANAYSISKTDLKEIVDNYAFHQDDIELNKEVVNLFKDNKDIDIQTRIEAFNAIPLKIKLYFERFNDITLY